MIAPLLALALGTFSIVAADPATGQIGVAVQSKFPAVGALVPAARAGVGGVATQALANEAWRAEALRLLAAGVPAEEVVKRLVAADPQAADRQIGLVDAKGDAAAYTGARCFDHASHVTGPGFSVQGNILAGRAVPEAMARAYQAARDAGKPLAERLLAALAAGQAAGGDRRGMESAALLVVKPGGGYGGSGDVWVDLRVDDHPQPIAELTRLYRDVHQFYFGETVRAVPLDAKVAREVRGALLRLGFLKAPAAPGGGAWDAASQQALEDFQGWENLEGRTRKDGTIDEVVLAHLRKVAARKR
ncbi:protein of unknown function DUF1028 [Anaeromyxobacter dehalogenans 2CP-1]|uniref:Putative peptidoglycan binding domain-containing protein n=1 Tax=Anaeromyxobacter dehalogenans (strain ATCC BAA-258 / DSM 21875 / 2CP-1) TaxID=455488 RepID=B8JGE7_ANAD2|nr:DUF1028 domain-containing protein [Anaeromyxobacter dehalogenans]ACL64618.1 protein of unknown function DUF1028 [Anaeromyxobacter dehalogenans 2CP-1]